LQQHMYWLCDGGCKWSSSVACNRRRCRVRRMHTTHIKGSLIVRTEAKGAKQRRWCSCMVVTARAEAPQGAASGVGCTLSTPCHSNAPWLPPVASSALACRGFGRSLILASLLVLVSHACHVVLLVCQRLMLSQGKRSITSGLQAIWLGSWFKGGICMCQERA
jgi:hypothetical protein